MPINKQKYNTYLQLKADPALALMRLIKEHEKEMEEYMTACDRKMEQIMEEKMAKMEQKEPMHADFIQKIINQAVAQVIGNSKGEKGDSIIGPVGPQGEKGDSIIGPRGERGSQGLLGGRGEAGRDGKDGRNGINGKTPVEGIDYFTEKDKQIFMDKIKESLKISEILAKLNELQKIVSNLNRNQKLGGQTIHRGGLDLIWNENVGTGDSATLAFDLDNTPYSSSELQVWVGGGIQFLTDDFTLSGKTITFLTAPPSGAVIRATYRRA